jgi:succinate dehydrogenase/fumarate reductase flavoprotein subunit
LNSLEEVIPRLGARNTHELMRVSESKNIYSMSRIMTATALFREESRFGLFHNRLDYPKTREEWTGQVVIEKKDDLHAKLEFVPLHY